MQQLLLEHQNLKEGKDFRMENHYFYMILCDFSIFLISKDNPFVEESNCIENEYKIIIIDEYKIEDVIYIVICFEKTILLISSNDFALLTSFFFKCKNYHIYILKNQLKSFLHEHLKFEIQIKEDKSLRNEIDTFLNEYQVNQIFPSKIWKVISRSISGFLIKKSYQRTFTDRIEKSSKLFKSSYKQIEFNEKPNNYIIFKTIKSSSRLLIQVVYHIEKQKLLVMKKIIGEESQKLIEREYKNYLNIHHPFLSRCYEMIEIKGEKVLILEYIEGKTLSNIKNMNLEYRDKIKIITEIMISLDYLHYHHYIYRDLKPDNVIIDKNQVSVLIDFDRMIQENEETKIEESTILIHSYASPEIQKGQSFSYSTDIYSLGMMIYFIIFEKDLDIDNIKEELDNKSKEYYSICKIIKDCINKNPNERPSISKLLNYFYINFFSTIHGTELENNIIQTYKNIHNDTYFPYWVFITEHRHNKSQQQLGVLFSDGEIFNFDINKTIYYFTQSANQNNQYAQFDLGSIYYEGEYIERDINKSIYYFTLSANQNNMYAQYNLGIIYYDNKYINRDLNKSIYFLTLAAKQNYDAAQFMLGYIYYENKYIPQDINKSIYYFTLAANQNYLKAQFILGYIYYKNEYIPQDISKSIYYLTQAANKNHEVAQYILGLIYFANKYIPQDINKSIYYFTLSANQNYLKAQFMLGCIYYAYEYIPQDINKSIYYFTLAANQNHLISQYMLGLIYYENGNITENINKSIDFLTLTANQNFAPAQLTLALIYLEGKYIRKNINKSIHYFSLAASQNNIEAQNSLGIIYYQGIYVTRDMNKSIYYLLRSANKNDSKAQHILGLIYFSGKYIDRDINKSIHYFTLAANNGYSRAQNNLGIIYYYGTYIKRDINKSIYYLTLASNHNNPISQNMLGCIYIDDKYIKRDIKKSIYYFTLAAKQNSAKAQYNLGLIYSMDCFVEKNMMKAIDYFIQSSSNEDINANFIVGYFYQEGKYLERNMKKSIYHYKKASSFNNKYAKNNLGIIYKNGILNEVSSNIGYAIEYFEETISQTNDLLSKYNLAHIYIYDYFCKDGLDKSIDLLIKSTNNFYPSIVLLCIALIKKNGFNIEKIEEELLNKSNQNKKLANIILLFIQYRDLINEANFEQFYKTYKMFDFLYRFDYVPIVSNEIYISEAKPLNEKLQYITNNFYEGFGKDIM